MTRGNQRDLVREKAAKKDKGKQKAANDQEANKGMTKEQRMARYVTSIHRTWFWKILNIQRR